MSVSENRDKAFAQSIFYFFNIIFSQACVDFVNDQPCCRGNVGYSTNYSVPWDIDKYRALVDIEAFALSCTRSCF